MIMGLTFTLEENVSTFSPNVPKGTGTAVGEPPSNGTTEKPLIRFW